MKNYTFVLANRALEHLGGLSNVDYHSVSYVKNLNSANELSFDIYKTLDGFYEPLWDDIKDLKLVYYKEKDEYFEISVSETDSALLKKTVTGTALCEAELSQVYLNDIQINTENDIARPDYDVKYPTVFYRPITDTMDSVEKDKAMKASLLHRVLDKVPQYTIGYVDYSLMNLQRTFEINGETIYDFLTGDCAEQFNCIFIFDSATRTISAYDLYTVCNECGYRGEYDNVCPECGGTDLSYFGIDTTVYVDKENLTNEVVLEGDKDALKNTFRVEAGDDEMTNMIAAINPNGSRYIYHFSEDSIADMPEDLRIAIARYEKVFNKKRDTEEFVVDATEYNALVKYINRKMGLRTEEEDRLDKDQYTDSHHKFEDIPDTMTGYSALMESIYNTIDFSLYLNSGMMPQYRSAAINATSEKKALEKAYKNKEFNKVALTSISSSTSASTVESALVNYSKVYVKSGYVKIEAETTSWDLPNRKWTGKFTITNYSDQSDVATTIEMTVTVTDDFLDFTTQKIAKKIASTNDDEDDGTLWEVLNTLEPSKFEEYITQYSKNRLKSFYDALNTAIDILTEAQQQTDSALLYEKLYVPYTAMLDLCQAEINKRDEQIATVESMYDELALIQSDVQSELNFEEFLGEALYKVFCCYRREENYQNSNFTSDGLNNSELFARARELYEYATKEVIKASNTQWKIQTTVNDLFQIEEFSALFDQIKKELDDYYDKEEGDKIIIINPDTGEEIIEDDVTQPEVEYVFAYKPIYPESDIDEDEVLYAFENPLELDEYDENDITPDDINKDVFKVIYKNKHKDFDNLFDTGNWIRVRVDDEVFRLRITKIEESADPVIHVEFSNVTRNNDVSVGIKSILDSASSMATSYGAVTKQSVSGKRASETIKSWMQNGMDTSQMTFTNGSDIQTQVWNEHGFLFGAIDDESGERSPEQMKILNNGLYLTNDNWKSVVTAIGKFLYSDELVYGVNAQTIMGKLLLGERMKISNENGTLDFDDTGLTIKNTNGDDVFHADTDGNLTVVGTIIADEIVLRGTSMIPSDRISGSISAARVEGISEVGKTGDYNDLYNTPDINDGVLTISKNGTEVGTFTANQGEDSVVDITVPTNVSELTNDSNYITKTSADSTYITDPKKTVTKDSVLLKTTTGMKWITMSELASLLNI